MKKAFLSIIGAAMLLGLAWSQGGGEKSVTNSLGMRLVRIDAGTFPMGSNISRAHWTEQPIHDVTISRPFYITETEVTLEQYRRFKPDFQGTPVYSPYAAGVSWHEAKAFADWLGRQEGKPYRLPTEAEWEYVARAGGTDPKAQAKNEIDRASAWEVKNMLAGAREWCLDWFGEYPAAGLTDPVGPESGSTKVVRGGALDLEERNILKKDFYRPQSRLSMAPAFGHFGNPPEEAELTYAAGPVPGLIGVWYDNPDLTDPQEVNAITRLNNSWSNDPRGGGSWSARWRGLVEAPCTGEVTFSSEAGSGLKLEIDGKPVIDTQSKSGSSSGKLSLVQGRKYPIVLSFIKSGVNQFQIYWSWPGSARELVAPTSLSYTAAEEKMARGEAKPVNPPGFHAIGFRLVQAPMPVTKHWAEEVPYVRQGVKATPEYAAEGPDMSKPYFRKRYLVPTPLDNSTDEAIDAVGMHPSYRRHLHSPGLEIMPNGDVLMVIFTSYIEYEPGMSLIAARLRFGAEEWDMPSRFVDFVGLNDNTPLLWNDSGTIRFFWSNTKIGEGGFPFQWTSSRDNGATWSETRFPDFRGRIGSHTAQPINTAFRDAKGRMYLSSDGSGSESVLWASDDDGKTWFDTGGRSAGRHTSFALLKDGRILGLGGKNSNIEGYMPQAISRDGARTYEVSKSPFPQQGSNQRPTLIRLRSGRLMFAADYVLHNDGSQPAGFNQLGSYAALSEDEGKTWRFKKLVGVQLHESSQRAEIMRGPTLGYAVARQAPNGMIHLIATMNNPCLHFEFNEAWLLAETSGERPDAELMASKAKAVAQVRSYEQRYPDGKPRISWSGGIADDGRFLLHGVETWYYPSGTKQKEAAFELGRKTGVEIWWSPEGKIQWTWEHRPDGTAVWTQYWPGGGKKAESSWRNFKAHGLARLWDPAGKLVSEVNFNNGVPARPSPAH